MDTQREMLGHANPMKKTDGIVPPQNGAAQAKERAHSLSGRVSSLPKRRVSSMLVAASIAGILVATVGGIHFTSQERASKMTMGETVSLPYYREASSLAVDGYDIALTEIAVPKGRILAVKYPYGPREAGYRARVAFLREGVASEQYIVEYEAPTTMPVQEIVSSGQISKVSRSTGAPQAGYPPKFTDQQWKKMSDEGIEGDTPVFTVYEEASRVLNNPFSSSELRNDVVRALMQTGVTVLKENVNGKELLRLAHTDSLSPDSVKGQSIEPLWNSVLINPATGFGKDVDRQAPIPLDSIPQDVSSVLQNALAGKGGSCSNDQQQIECTIARGTD